MFEALTPSPVSLGLGQVRAGWGGKSGHNIKTVKGDFTS